MQTCRQCGVPIVWPKAFCSATCRIKRNVEAVGTGCWIWTGAAKPSGYGRIRVDGVTMNAHRASFIAFRGAIPADHVVRHTCHNPRCVNPNHLILGTVRDNVRDMHERRGYRQPQGFVMNGSDNPNARLTAEKVAEIRASDKPTRELAALYGVGRQTIGDIRARRRWKHI